HRHRGCVAGPRPREAPPPGADRLRGGRRDPPLPRLRAGGQRADAEPASTRRDDPGEETPVGSDVPPPGAAGTSRARDGPRAEPVALGPTRLAPPRRGRLARAPASTLASTRRAAGST